MGHEGKILVKKEDKRVDQSTHTACNLFGGSNLFATNHDGETTGDKSIHQLSHPAELAFTHSRDLVCMDSSITEILERFEDDKIYSVGIVGMGGSGKTTLAKEVGKRGKELNVFNQVLFINMSQSSNEKKIQDQIAEGLGLKLVTEDLRARAEQVFVRLLRSEKQILIILDDIWSMLDLQQIGIPSFKNHMGSCKLVLTSRNASVVQSMECQFLFRQYLLSDEAAWSLFCTWAGIRNISLDPRIYDVSRQFVRKYCRGHPLAALLAGGGLRRKSCDEWVAAMNMIKTLKDSDIFYSDNLILSLCQWSYYNNGLSNKVARSLFLMSGLFPEGEILIEHLSHYAIVLGLCDQNEVNAALNSLIYCGLLMHYKESKDHVIMHDIVREAAQWIVEKENPAHRGSIRRYLMALRDRDLLFDFEYFRWKEELDALVHQMFHVRSTTSSSIVEAFSPHVAVTYTHPEPSGKLVDFKGLCRVDESYLPLLKEACKRYPQLIKCQAKYSRTLKQTAFNSLGQLLFMVSNGLVQDWVYLKDELKIYWNQALLMEFDLEWLKPVVDRVLSSTEIHRIEALRKEEEKRNAEAAKLRQQLNEVEAKAAKLRQQLNEVEAKAAKLRQQLNEVEAKAAKLRQQLNHVEPEAAHFRMEIALLESKLKSNGFAIAHVSNTSVVTKVTSWWKVFWKRK